jgi:hypothetical protein
MVTNGFKKFCMIALLGKMRREVQEAQYIPVPDISRHFDDSRCINLAAKEADPIVSSAPVTRATPAIHAACDSVCRAGCKEN